MPKNKKRAYRPSCDVYRRSRKINIQPKSTAPLVARGFGSGHTLLAVTFLMMSAAYLFTVNANAVRGERVNTLDASIKQAALMQEELRIDAAQMRSQRHVEEIVTHYGMEPIDDPLYIDAQTTVALDF